MKRLAVPCAPLLGLLVASGCSSSGSGGSSGAGRADATDFRPIAGGDALYVWSGGLDATLVDPKDAAVRDALRELGVRLLELPEETGNPEIPGDALELLATALQSPMSLSVGPAPAESVDELPVRAQLSFRHATPEEARKRADRLARAISELGLPSLGLDEANGLSTLDFGGEFSVVHGVAKAGRADTIVIGTGALDHGERDLGTLDLPGGVKPAMAFRMDYGAFGDLLERFGGPEASAAFAEAGLGDVVIQGACGHGDDRSYAAVRTIGWVEAARASGALPSGAIEREALARIPRDAGIAMVGRADIAGMTRKMVEASATDEAAAAFGGVDPLAIVREMTGVDLQRDLIDHLGQTVGFYTSDATGGGGFFSAVAFARVANEAQLREALGRLETSLEDLAADHGLPQMSLRRSQHRGAAITTLAFSGWPIPVEPSWTIAGGWLYAGASVQALRAALDQAADGGDDLTDAPRFDDELSGRLDDLQSLTYVDVPRFVRDGYPLAVMLGAALSNGISSAGAPDRVPPGIVPAYGAFVDGARATLALGRIEGQDLVVRSQGDRSILVQMAGFVGAMGPLPMLLGGLIAAGAAEDDEVEAIEFEMEDGEPDMEEMDEDGEIDMEEDVFVPAPETVPPQPPPGDPK